VWVGLPLIRDKNTTGEKKVAGIGVGKGEKRAFWFEGFW